MEADQNLVEHYGGCHCGAVRFVAKALSRVTVHICNCSICTKKQLKGFIVPRENFRLLKGIEDMALYKFNTEQAKHFFCKFCGVESFYEPRSNPDGISVMTYCIDGDTIKEVNTVEFDGQNWEKSILKGVPVYS